MKFKDYLNESSLSRIWKLVSQYESGTISAHRSRHDCGEGEKITNKENKQRNRILKAKMLSAGYQVTKVKGTYIENFKSKNEIEVREDSFIVIDNQNKGTLKKDLIKFGAEFEQDSITYSKPSGEYYLIGTNKCPNGYPGWYKEIKLGKPFFGKNGEFHSQINGRPFVFEEVNHDIEELKDFTVTEIRSIKNIAKQGKLFN